MDVHADARRARTDTITLEPGPREVTWPIASLTGEEAINALFDFRVSIVVPEGQVELGAWCRKLLGARVRLELGALDAAHQTRYAIVVDARVAGAAGDDRRMQRVVLHVAPTAWLLTQRRKSRIFQRRYLHEIVGTVLSEAGVRHRWSLMNRYPRRVYCVQYDETDWDFVTRLLAEEGAMLFFEHPSAFVPAPVTADEDTNPLDVVSDLLVGSGEVTQAIGEAVDSGWTSLAGQTAQVAGNLLGSPQEDEEDPAPREPGAGSGGPAGAGDVLVFVDRVVGYTVGRRRDEEPTPLALRRVSEGDLVGEGYAVTAFGPRYGVRPDVTETRDHDFRRPMLLLRSQQRQPDASILVDGSPRPLEVYSHEGEYEKPDVTDENTRTALEQHRARGELFFGASDCPRVLPGHVFALGSAGESVAEGSYVPTRAVHSLVNVELLGAAARSPAEGVVRGVAQAIQEAVRGRDPLLAHAPWRDEELRELIQGVAEGFRAEQPVPYRCVFECARAAVPVRPPVPQRAPRNVTETAMVVGPRGEDVYTDRFGRVKIQFHWDREGQWTERSSCWVRVAQPWAGAGFGFQFVPRVGMEVLVTFVRGDPDRPVIIGALYDAAHETPEPLPTRKSRSAIRTQSTPDGGGFNELSFEDEKGNERVTLRAEKDLGLVANDHHARTIGTDETVVVGRNQSVAVGERQRTGVRDHQATLVGGDQSASVGGNRVAAVTLNEMTFIDGNRVERVRGASTATVGGDVALQVGGSQTATVLGDVRTQVGRAGERGHMHAVKVEGVALTVAKDVRLLAQTGDADDPAPSILLVTQQPARSGDDTSLIWTKPTEVTIRAKRIVLKGGEEIVLEAPRIVQKTGRGAEMRLDGPSAGLHGSPVEVTPRRESTPKPSGDPTTAKVRLRFTHARPGKSALPLKKVSATVSIPPFKEALYTTDDGGVLTLEVPRWTRSFTALLYAHKAYPALFSSDADPLTFVVHLRKTRPALNTADGVRFRLSDLGYAARPLGEERAAAPDAAPDTALDAVTRRALQEFQHDVGVPRTGKLDEATLKALAAATGEK